VEHARTLITAVEDPATDVLDVYGILARRHQAEVNGGRLELNSSEGTLQLRGPKALVETCLRELDALQAAVTRPIEVTAMLLPASATAATAGAVGVDVVAELQKQQPSWLARTRTRPGNEVALGRERWTPYVRDIDVEVGETRTADDPKVDAAMSGVRVVVAVHPLPEGDDLLLLGWFAVGESVELREQARGAEGQGSIDLPEWRSASGTFAARIQNGGAALVVANAASPLAPSFTLAVSARCMAPAVSVVAPGLQLVPVSALCSKTHMQRAAIGSAVRLPGDDHSTFEQGPAERDFGQVPAEVLPTLVAVDGVSCSVQGGFLVIESEAGREAVVSAALRRLCDQRLRNAEVQVVLTEAGGTHKALLSMAQPSLLGREAWFFLGHEQACIADFEVEIGKQAAANNPIVRVAQAGIWSRVRLRPAAGGLSCDALWQVAAQQPPRERPFPGSPPGNLGLITTDVAAFPWDAPMQAARELDLGDGPPFLIDGKSVPSRLTVQVSAR
jgi:hypothetical protein